MKKKITLKELSQMVEGKLVGDAAVEITGFDSLNSAGSGDISFLVKAQYLEQLEQSKASAFLVSQDIEISHKKVVKVDDAYLASAIVQNYFLKQPFVAGGIHETAVIGDNCRISDEVSIAPHVVIGDQVSIGNRVQICAGVVIGDGVIIGDECTIKANVTIEHECQLGDQVTIHANTVIGSDGYGYATDKRGFHVKRPQLGIVRIGDDVEIGSNCSIDRATFGETWIKSGTKIDNLVQVGHNVVVGENSLLVGQVGISGSVILGKNVVFGGNAGASGHQTIGDGTMVAGFSAVHGDQPAGSRLAGIPAVNAKLWLKSAALFSKLPELVKDVRKIKKELARLSKQDNSKSEEG